MSPKSSYAVVGFFVLLLGTALIAGILWLSTGGPPKDYDFYLVYMTESVSGLNIDAPVKYKGVNVGRVREVGLNPRNPEQVRLLLVVLQGTPVNADTVATLEIQGLATGIAHINLSGGSLESGPLAQGPDDYPVIPSRPSLLVRLDDTVSELLASLIFTSNQVGTLLSNDNQLAIAETLSNLRFLTTDLLQHTGDLGEMMADLRATLAQARVASGDFPALMARLQAGAAAFEHMAKTLADTGITIQTTVDDIGNTVRVSGADLQDFTGSALPEVRNLVFDLRETAATLRRVTEILESDPSVLLFGPRSAQPGPGEKGTP